MPRLRKPPVEENEEVEIISTAPPEDGVTIELDGDVDDGVTVELTPEVEKTPEPVPQPEPMEQAVEADRRAAELAEANRQRDAAIAAVRQRDAELARERAENRQRSDRLQQAEYSSVLSAIGEAQSVADSMQAAYVNALAAQDFAAAGDAQRKMVRAEASLSALEDRKAFLEQAKDQPQPQPQPPRPQPPVQRTIEERIQLVQNADAQNWLRKHPEFITDATKNQQIGAAHQYLVNVKNVAAFSPTYFAALDAEFGFKGGAAPQSPPPPPPAAATPRSIPVSAPVSRDVPGSNGQRDNPRQMHLTAEERDIARKSRRDLPPGKAERLYAENKALLAKKRVNGSYPQRGEA